MRRSFARYYAAEAYRSFAYRGVINQSRHGLTTQIITSGPRVQIQVTNAVNESQIFNAAKSWLLG